MSYSGTSTTSFTRTHAKHLAAKVVADLYQCSLLYGRPTADRVGDYQEELVELLAGEYVDSYEFGFKTNGMRVLSWQYTVGADGGLHGDSAAGSLLARAAVADASYYNFLSYSSKWSDLTSAERAAIKAVLPFARGDGELPGDGSGYWQDDHGYSAGGVRVQRRTFRPW